MGPSLPKEGYGYVYTTHCHWHAVVISVDSWILLASTNCPGQRAFVMGAHTQTAHAYIEAIQRVPVQCVFEVLLLWVHLWLLN